MTFDDSYFTHKDIIDSINKECGRNAILGLVKTGREWRVSLREDVDVDSLCSMGLIIDGHDVLPRHINRHIVTVSFFGVPYYIGNQELSSKLTDFGVKQLSSWTRKTYDDFPDIENGIVFCRIELPRHIISLPYATVIDGVNLQIKHNGQTKVCNFCLSEDHLMRSCPRRLRCFKCGLIGHLRHDCPDEEVPDDSISTASDDLSGGESSGALLSDQASLASSSELVIDEDKDDEPPAPDHSTDTSSEQPPNAEPATDPGSSSHPAQDSQPQPPTETGNPKRPRQSTDDDETWTMQQRKSKKRDMDTDLNKGLVDFNRYDVLNDEDQQMENLDSHVSL